ncbi:MAG: hypothetical protein C0602_06040 [Denitrovibrio sp.]|nr:MAG: hypothetical protein C0602_06040 [Denitrovibrio sp.]
MKDKFNIVEHVLDHQDYFNDKRFNYKLSHSDLSQFVISFHDLQFLERQESSLEILSKITDEIKEKTVTWKERKELKAEVKYYERFGRTEDCLAVVHDHADHPHIHFVYPKLQLNKKQTKYIKRGYGLNFHQLKCHIKTICDRYSTEPNFYLTSKERQAFRSPNINMKLKKTLSHLSWQMKQNPDSRIKYSREQIMRMLERYGKQSGDMSFVNKFIRLWNETQNDDLPPALLEHDQKLLEILEENDSEKLLSSINETNYRSIILNDLIRFIHKKATNLLHELTDLAVLQYPKSIAKKILSIKKKLKNEILERSQKRPVKPSIYDVFNRALSHVMRHSRGFDDLEKNMKCYFDDFGFAGLPHKKVDEFIPVLNQTLYFIPTGETPYKKNKLIRQRLIKNTLDNVPDFRPLHSIKKQIDLIKQRLEPAEEAQPTLYSEPPDLII